MSEMIIPDQLSRTFREVKTYHRLTAQHLHTTLVLTETHGQMTDESPLA